MALTKVKKAEKVAELAKELEGSTSAIVGTFAKLTVAQDFALRGIVRGAGAQYRVLKNKLAARASQGTGVEQALQGLKGVSSVAYTSGDPVALAKALTAWVKDNSEFTFKLGIVEGRVITVEEVGKLATMPGKEEIYAKLLFLLQSPAQRLATVLNATGRDLAVVLNQGVEKEKFTAAAPAAAKVEAPAKPVVEAAAPAVEAKSEQVAEVAAPIVEAGPEPAPATTAPVAEAAVEAPAEAALSEASVEEVTPEPVAEAAAPVAEAAVEAPAPVEAAVTEIPIAESAAVVAPPEESAT